MKPLSNWKLMRLVLFVFAIVAGSISPVFSQWNPAYAIGTSSGNYVYSYNQTPDPLVEIYAPLLVNNTGSTLVYQWEQSSSPVSGFNSIVGATGSTYSFSGPLQQTTYFRRRTIDVTGGLGNVLSNTFKIQVSSVNWENLNYIREHDVLVPGITDWKTVDQLPIGQKLQVTTYIDGLGRSLEKVSKETATPVSGTSLWGDVVQFSLYDANGRQPLQYLPYTTRSQSGSYKTTPLTEQSQYYSNNYNDGHAYAQITYDNSPLSRVMNVKSSGNAWNAGSGNSAIYDLNDASDNVQILSWVYGNSYPSNIGYYSANSLYKNIHLDENGKQVIEYINNIGQLILKKIQLDDNPSAGTSGWICTYSVYDDYGRLRYQIQPEAVKWLDANGWNFAYADGLGLLDGMCFRYDYDDKGRTIAKKAPGAKQLNMVYDNRDRIVFMQDGNQAAKPTPEWTANVYDELDRLSLVCLYHTTQSIAGLQSIAANTNGTSSVSVTNAGQAIVDLVLDNRNQATSNNILAQNSITLTSDAGGDFITNDNEEFTASIDASATTPATNTTVNTYGSAISASDLTNPAVTTILKYLYYDDYNFTGAKSFDNNFNNSLAYSGDAAYITIAPSQRTLSYPTGSRVRVLNTNTFLVSTHYYDEKGRAIQSLEDNIKSGTDITTMQYHWDGRLLSSQTKHSTALTGYNSFSILTKYLFDNIGRVTDLQKKYGDNGFKTIASYEYDDVGRLKTKHLDPGYTGSGKSEMESLTYSYNIHSQITGINKDYALKAGGYNKWNNFFGLYIGFDNRDNTFNTANLNGQVTGLLWNTQGDDEQRKYDYTYDNAGRLIKADFKEYSSQAGWSNAKMDFSVGGNGTNGTIQYDLNGNLLSMMQKGVVPGQGVVTVDNLAYSYKSYSNKLASVTDNGTLGNLNGQLGDFKDGTNSGDDYVYDDNGNLIVDLNKNATELNSISGGAGISYNYLDKPEQVRIKGKGLIQFVYDADGTKLQKIYTPEGSSTATATTYINQFVYTETATANTSSSIPLSGGQGGLSYINFEEGRIRAITPVSTGNGYDAVVIDGNMLLPSNTKGVYDFYIRDYQQNVRMIVTEETHTGSNLCTMETGRASAEDPVFGQTGGSNEVETTRFDATQIPGTWPGNTTGSVSRLSKNTNPVGPNNLLKVMAGDNLSATVQYYYQGAANNNSSNSLANDIANNLLSVISNSPVTSVAAKGGAAAITANLNNTAPFANVTDPNLNTTDNLPRAYLSVVFFDERFNFVGENSTVVRVNGNTNSSLTIPNVQAPKNGYAYIYLSNESDLPVYFDNFNVAYTRGRIIEENHYYAYGLKIAGISSKKLGDPNEGSLKNNNLYNDKEIDDEADLDWLDYGFRNYDPQIGRFVQIDPLVDETPVLSGYHYALNDPITNIDEDGLSGLSVVQQVACWTGQTVGSVKLMGTVNEITHIIAV